ncbi:MAG: IS481 family transposase [Candidatus Limnocylindria bacterium]
MGLERYVVDAVVLEGRSPSEIARRHGISRSWLYQLLARYRQGGYPALAPRSRRPHTSPGRTPPEQEAAILALRAELGRAGHDCGPATIVHHLGRRFPAVPSPATVWRILRRHGLIRPQPHKRPRSSWVRFEAALPNELWQADATHWRLADGSPVEILDLIDDHSRLLLAAVAFRSVTGLDVVRTFLTALASYGPPAALLTDNGAVFTAGPRRGKVLLETELERLGIAAKHSTPNHPQTCGKVERLHQTLKRYLACQPAADSLAMLQLQLDAYRAYYNAERPHRALRGATPQVAFERRLKARPTDMSAVTHFRVRADRVSKAGNVTVRYLSQLRHIGLGKAHAGEPVRLLIADAHVRVVREDGSLLRELTIDAGRDYQPRLHSSPMS